MTNKEIAEEIGKCMAIDCSDCEYNSKQWCFNFRKEADAWLARCVKQENTEKYGTEYNPDDVAFTKDDQSLKADAGKPELCLIPLKALIPVARVREYGIKKYGSKEGWRDVSIERYQNAAFRHWIKYLNDPHGVDEESGLPHLWHCLTNLMFLTELEDLHDQTDNPLLAETKMFEQA